MIFSFRLCIILSASKGNGRGRKNGLNHKQEGNIMVVIRGATTIEHDDKDEIRKAVRELLEQIESRNGIKESEIVSIVFSSTSDIHSYYPAKAAREAGFESCSLFSAMEPEIVGGLNLCIRVMMFIEKNVEPHHVYLRGARVLRKDLTAKINVAIIMMDPHKQ